MTVLRVLVLRGTFGTCLFSRCPGVYSLTTHTLTVAATSG